MECVFCQIVSGEPAASVVTEDAMTVAFMDLRQPHGGHVLVVPKQHVEFLHELTDQRLSASLMGMLVRVAAAVQVAFEPAGISITQANGVGAGQEVPHVHFHVHPRQVGDGLIRIYASRPPQPARDDLDRQAAAIRAALKPLEGQ
jgi:histidine triad (HIT) family protein